MNVVRLQTHRPDCSRPATDAGTFRRDDELTVPFTEARKLKKAVRSNLEGFGYGV
jgi:hypothetical protein